MAKNLFLWPQMQILLFARKFPYPINDGESIAIHALAKALVAHGVTIDLFSLNTSKDYYDYNTVPDQLAYYRSIESVDIDIDITMSGALYNLLSGAPYHVSRYQQASVSLGLMTILKNNSYDVIQLEGAHLLPYLTEIRAHSDAQVVLRAHNIEHQIWMRQANIEKSSWKRWYLGLQAARFKRYEEQLCAKVDGVLSISPVDQLFFEGHNDKVINVPIGMGLVLQNEPPQQDCLRVGFIGSMDWMPNQNGLQWFMDEVWPKDGSNTYKLILAGKNFDHFRYAITDDAEINLLGEIEDAQQFWDKIDILIVPLFSGSGTRVKILEALSRGKIVLSTSIGAEGIQLSSGINGYISDDIQEWKKILGSLNLDSVQTKMMKKEAMLLIEKDHNSNKIAADLMNFYKLLLKK